MILSSQQSELTPQKDLLIDIHKWIRFQGMQLANEVMKKTLIKDSDKLAYHFSDGRPSTQIAKLSGVSDFTIRAYWKSWAALGIVVPSPSYKGRYERVFSLEQFGLDIPPSKDQIDENSTNNQSTQPPQPPTTPPLNNISS